MKSEFTSAEFAEQLGLKVNTLHYYVQSGAITPDIDPGSGTGTKRLFSLTNYFEAILISQLMNLGVPKRGIVAMLKSIRDAGDRERLNPKRMFSELGSTYNYLVFFRKGKGYSHRFISHGWNQPSLKRKEVKRVLDVTSTDRLEPLPDVLHKIPVGITIDLGVMLDMLFFNRLYWDTEDDEE